MARQRSVFDIIGPVMIGPSSSHTAGAVRLGALARAVFGEQPVAAVISLHGSFASTGHGHGTDLALVAGLLGMRPDDGRIPDAHAEAERAGMAIAITEADLGEVHPNTAAFVLKGADGRTMRVQGSSLGGGDVVITDVDGFEVEVSGELPVLLVEHQDRPGEVARTTKVLAEHGINIASMQVSREKRGARALMLIETDGDVDPAAVATIAAIDGVSAVRAIRAV
jgi:L-serine dehydratase